MRTGSSDSRTPGRTGCPDRCDTHFQTHHLWPRVGVGEMGEAGTGTAVLVGTTWMRGAVWQSSPVGKGGREMNGLPSSSFMPACDVRLLYLGVGLKGRQELKRGRNVQLMN